jgi:hypothetical protein
LSTIATALDEDARGVYKTHALLSCLITDTLQAVLSMGLTDAQLDDHTILIGYLRSRCNADQRFPANRNVIPSELIGHNSSVQIPSFCVPSISLSYSLLKTKLTPVFVIFAR